MVIDFRDVVIFFEILRLVSNTGVKFLLKKLY